MPPLRLGSRELLPSPEQPAHHATLDPGGDSKPAIRIAALRRLSADASSDPFHRLCHAKT